MTADYASLADDLVLAYADGDEVALARISAHFEQPWSAADLRTKVWSALYSVRRARGASSAFQRPQAEEFLCRLLGFSNWEALQEWAVHGEPAPLPPLKIEASEHRASLQRFVRRSEWDSLLGLLAEHQVVHFQGGATLNDEALARLTQLRHIKSLGLEGARHISPQGLQVLARMAQLEELDLSGGNWSDEALAVLAQLPNLKRFKMVWQNNVSDTGIRHLRHCHQLESVLCMGSALGDGLLQALRGKAHLRHLETGKLLSDSGLALLGEIPLFRQPGAETQLLLDGPFTNHGFRHLEGLDGVAALDFFWHADQITSDAFAALRHMANLVSIGCDGSRSDDTAFAHFAAIPQLRKLRAQDAPATDAGFEALSRSATLEEFWGRDSQGLRGPGFRALSRMPRLRKLGVDLQNIDDDSLAHFAHFPALREITPIGLDDHAFRHLSRCHGLEKVSCMYCRDTTDLATGHLSALPLKSYYAGLTQITDRSLEILGRITTLEEVEFYETKQLSNAGLPHLANLPRLKKASFFGIPQITLAGTSVFPPAVEVDFQV
jgi:hypothetical protein